jgi:hypothetical protein
VPLLSRYPQYGEAIPSAISSENPDKAEMKIQRVFQ